VVTIAGSPASLMKSLGDENRFVCRAAGEALAKIGLPAVPELCRALAAAEPGIKVQAAGVLGRIYPAVQEAVPHLRSALRDADMFVRWAAATSLGRMGPAAEEAIPDLREAAKDEYTAVRVAARNALKRLSPI
jgi:HEAT repeat protein